MVFSFASLRSRKVLAVGLASVVAVGGLALNASTASASGGCATTVVRYGNSGNCVAVLQIALNSSVANSKLNGNGYFGAATLEEVKELQSKKSLTVDGVVGPRTWAALNVVASSGDAARGVQPRSGAPRVQGPAQTSTASFKKNCYTSSGRILGRAKFTTQSNGNQIRVAALAVGSDFKGPFGSTTYNVWVPGDVPATKTLKNGADHRTLNGKWVTKGSDVVNFSMTTPNGTCSTGAIKL